MSASPRSSCARVRSRLVRLADGGLAPLDEARDRGHLEACAACARALGEHERGVELLRAALRGSLDAEIEADVERVAAAVRARLATRSPPRTRLVALPGSPRGASVRGGAGLAACAAALLATLGSLALGEARAPFTPRPLELARPHDAAAALPGWSDVLGGLARLARGAS